MQLSNFIIYQHNYVFQRYATICLEVWLKWETGPITAVCFAGQNRTIYVEKSVGVRKCIFFCLIDSPHSRFRVQMPFQQWRNTDNWPLLTSLSSSGLDLLFNHEHLDRSLEQHMAMNCLKYFISEVVFVFNDFCHAQRSTYKNKNI